MLEEQGLNMLTASQQARCGGPALEPAFYRPGRGLLKEETIRVSNTLRGSPLILEIAVEPVGIGIGGSERDKGAPAGQGGSRLKAATR